MQGLIRTLKAKDQHIQESGVKIELMERRMEGVKKQGEMIADLEAELQKARKQERAYEEAMEQLQSDLDALEQDNKRLKAAASTVERQGEYMRLVSQVMQVLTIAFLSHDWTAAGGDREPTS